MNNKTTLRVLIIVAVSCFISVVIMAVSLIFGGKSSEQPPFYQFEAEASVGYPAVTDEQQLYTVSNYTENFRAYVCRNAVFEGKALTVGFTNPEESGVLMQLYIYGENERYLGKTGVLKSGEYVMNARLERKPKDGEMLSYKVICYEYDTYFSAGVANGEGTALKELP